MPITKFLQEAKRFEILTITKSQRFSDLRDTHVPFSGTPHRHPYATSKFILMVDPYCSSVFYEFDTEDIDFVEELPSIVNLDGETMTMVLVWVKKQSVALRCSPFVVESLAPGNKG
ncbi:MAG: inorganic pyrophosphatase Ppa [Proteobacteria bacterium]|nr:inorganic pyrophosphatase Ppa [Desulfobulbaceae bacterium]MBU4151823.1 inorganic pyrophosphatase Ppa [Pseudomonadota bacterium]